MDILFYFHLFSFTLYLCIMVMRMSHRWELKSGLQFKRINRNLLLGVLSYPEHSLNYAHQVTTREATRAEKVRDDWFVASPFALRQSQELLAHNTQNKQRISN